MNKVEWDSKRAAWMSFFSKLAEHLGETSAGNLRANLSEPSVVLKEHFQRQSKK